MARRTKRKRRRKHSPDEPLELTGTVPCPVEKPAPKRLWLSPLRGLVDALPVHSETRRGREFAVFLRLTFGIAALMMVTKGRQHWGWGLAGILTALSTVVVPLGETRRRRWQRRLDALSAPTTVQEDRPARLEFDGRKASIRVDGRVWRSLRPFDPPGQTRLVEVGGTLWLGVLPPEGRKRDPLWFWTEAEALADRVTDVERVDAAPDTGMALESTAFVAVHEAFLHRL